MNRQKQISLVVLIILLTVVLYWIGIYSVRGAPRDLPLGIWESHWDAGGFVVNRVVVDPTNPQTVFAATSQGVYKSTDGGMVWILKPNGLPGSGTQNTLDLAIDPCSHSDVYIVEGSHARKSIDGGENWSDLYTFGYDLVSAKAIAVGCNHNNLLVASAALVGGADYIDRSTDGGISWNGKLSVGLIGAFNRIVFDPNDQSQVYATHDGEGGVYKSSDSGEHWNPSYSGLPSSWNIRQVRDIDFNSGAAWVTINAGSTHGLYKSINQGLTWENVKNDFTNTDVTTLAFDGLGNIYLGTSSTGGTAMGVYNCSDEGITCLQMNSGFGANLPDIYDLAYGGGTLFAATKVGVWQYQVVAPPASIYLPIILSNP